MNIQKNNKKNNYLVCAIIPAYNEALTITKVIKKTLAFVDKCVVVNDNSSDNTSILAKKAGAVVIDNCFNMGTGKAIQVGLKHGLKNGFSHFILLDADGQHDPKYIKKLLNNLDSDIDLVIASRYLKNTNHCTSFIRRLGTRLISLMIWWKYKVKISDPTSGFRCLSKPTVKLILKDCAGIFPDPEILISLIKKKKKIKEVLVPMKPRRFGTSTISLTKACYLMAYISFKIIKE